MPDFRYTALDKSGKETTGTVTGRDTDEAAARVRAMGYYPTGLSASNGSHASASAPVQAVSSGKKVPRLQVLLFTREAADLFDAGLPIDRAITVLIEQSDNAELRAMLQHMQGDIRAGKPFSDALRAFPREFPPLYANMIHAGEISGQLPEVMTRLADFLEKEQVRRSQIVAALTYPMVLIAVATTAVAFLLAFVIPRLQAVFKDLGADLPVPTQILLAMSGFVGGRWWALALGIGTVYGGFRAWVATPGGRHSFDSIRLGAPLLGDLTRRIVMARFTRTLGTLLGGGVPILSALDIASTAVGNVVVADAVGVARNGVRQGETLSTSMENTGAFLPLVVHMAAVGEETGRLGRMLVRTSDTLDFEVDNTMRRLTSLVEPLVVLLMGGFVGFVVLSVLLPIFQTSTIVK